VGACLLLIAVTAVPLLLGVGSWITVAGNAVLGLAFLWFGVRAVQTKEKMAARHLLRASVSYLPLVFLLLYFHP
jgi:protoheme IX farnesyltransferase